MLNTMFPNHSVKPHTSATEILITKTHTIRGMCQLLILMRTNSTKMTLFQSTCRNTITNLLKMQFQEKLQTNL